MLRLAGSRLVRASRPCSYLGSSSPLPTASIIPMMIAHTKPLLQTPMQLQQTRSLVETEKRKKSKSTTKSTKGRKKAKQRKEQARWYREDQTGKMRMKNLHPAAKMKRVISACDYWFSDGNLMGDSFLQQELRDYEGWVRLSTLLDFPKLEHWCDANIIMNALDSEACSNRYQVVFNRELVEKVALNKQRRKRRQAKEEKEREKQRKKEENEHRKERDNRIEELEKYLDKTRTKWFFPIYKQNSRQNAEKEARRRKEEIAQKRKDLEARWLRLTILEKASNVAKSQMEHIQELLSQTKSPEQESEERKMEIGAYKEANIDCDDYHLGKNEETLMEENDEFRAALLELKDLWSQKGSKRENRDCWMDKDFRPQEARLKAQEEQKERDYFETLGLVDDETILEAEELPSLIQDDGSDLLLYGLVRHKKVTPEYVSNLTRGTFYRFDEMYEESLDDDLVDAAKDAEEGGEEAKAGSQPIKGNKRKSLKRYSSCRQIHLVKNSERLKCFCKNLRQSVGRTTTKAIGFDVEYCTLEMDIRNTLPAMLQIASPEPNGPVGLIWLDKFPNHGRDLISDDGCKDLISILSDHQILKVGPAVSKDAKNLANWWGITESNYVGYYFSGLADLDNELDSRLTGKSLQDMCADVLERNLPKVKEKGAKSKKEKRKKGRGVKTSHWRRNDLTNEMKKYAADDASCAIEVWIKVQEESSTISVGATNA
uniref:HTH La-type RNA-binding domain-containing protein n=1 Tax=Odontella aurita TaxID=265563 RepID=A0A7S4J1M4_9STRA|mmetsp:Transcript_35884/g.107151  ORF Transcript_35884/g.107151 Transcript_35884/m.107151 type:complete len:714 (+) Transcript_35884:524-2665(+)